MKKNTEVQTDAVDRLLACTKPHFMPHRLVIVASFDSPIGESEWAEILTTLTNIGSVDFAEALTTKPTRMRVD